MSFLSPAQLLGYLAFALGVAAFLQRSDRRLKLLLAVESLAYVAHFALLGNPSASGSALVNAVRLALSARYRSPWLAAAAVAAYLGVGVTMAHGAGWLPVVGGALGSVAVFTMHGLRMRLVLLVCTGLWLANNVLSGSIGGTLLEAFIAGANVFTLVRLARARPPGAAGQSFTTAPPPSSVAQMASPSNAAAETAAFKENS